MALKRLFKLGKQYERLTGNNEHDEAETVMEQYEWVKEMLCEEYMAGGLANLEAEVSA